jgi:hypothetical protein
MRQEGVICDFDFRKLSPTDIQIGAQKLIDHLRSEYDKVGNLSPDDITFESCIQVQLKLLLIVKITMFFSFLNR